ncbi:tricarboxylate transport mitochondrial [Nannochloropsis oceanica]
MTPRTSTQPDPAPPPRHALTPILAGGLAGWIEICITFPCEFTKTQCQLKQHYQLKKFTGPLDCVRYTLRTKGPFGLYKGLMPWLVFAFPRSAVRFSTYEYASHALQNGWGHNDGGGKKDPLLTMTAGTLAGAMEFLTVGTPMQCIQIKMAQDSYSLKPRFAGFADAVVGIVRMEGFWGGLYAGTGPTVLKGALNNCIRFSTYSELKHLYQQFKTGDIIISSSSSSSATTTVFVENLAPLNAAESMLLGAISGGLSAVATHPIDTVKSNMQSIGGGGYSTSWDCFTKILQSQGLLGLYRGMSPRFIRVCLEIGLHFTMYERIARYLDSI